MPSGSTLVVYGAIVGNAMIAISKFVAAAFTGSSAMISEGIHSTVDTGDGLLLLLGQHRSKRPPDERHPFGHGREIYFWSLIVAVMIFGVGGGMSVYEGITHLMHPTKLEDPTWNYVVLGIAALFEGTSLGIAIREFLHVKEPDEGIWKSIRTSKDPGIYTILFEDSAALVGLLIAFLGVWLGHRLQTPYADGIASILIGCVLTAVAVMLIYESKGLLIGESADREQVNAIRKMVSADPAVKDVGQPLTTYLAPHDILLNLDVRFRDQLTLPELESAVDRLEKSIRQTFPDIHRIFIEAESLRRTARG